MAAGDTQITLVGNCVDSVELRFTPSGQAVARFRLASTPRFLDKQTDTWKDGESLFLTVNVWRQAAENCAESLEKGMRVIVQGRLKQRSYETREGEKRTVYEVEADEVGPSLKNATAKVNKTQRQGGGGGGFGGGGQGGGGGFGGGGQGGGGGFGGDQGQQPQGGFGQQGGQPPQGGGGNAPADDPWATGQPAGGGFSEDPPF